MVILLFRRLFNSYILTSVGLSNTAVFVTLTDALHVGFELIVPLEERLVNLQILPWENVWAVCEVIERTKD